MKVNGPELLKLRAEGWTLQRLADKYGVSRAGVSLYCSRERTRENVIVELVPCACGCGVTFKPARRDNYNNYATRECYFRHVEMRSGHKYVQWVHGTRIARKVVTAAGFALQPPHVVHHVDSNNRNNNRGNLWVFACHADHMSYHRGGDGCPIWCGLPETLTV